MNQSEVARLRQQIELQLEAMRLGMSGLATGRARHAFIRAQMDRIGADQVRSSHTRGCSYSCFDAPGRCPNASAISSPVTKKLVDAAAYRHPCTGQLPTA